jgi:hypothetical protein
VEVFAGAPRRCGGKCDAGEFDSAIQFLTQIGRQLFEQSRIGLIFACSELPRRRNYWKWLRVIVSFLSLCQTLLRPLACRAQLRWWSHSCLGSCEMKLTWSSIAVICYVGFSVSTQSFDIFEKNRYFFEKRLTF